MGNWYPGIRINTKSRPKRRKVQPPTVTTTVQPSGSSGTTETVVVDVSTNPYLRSIDVQFIGHSLRPQRQVYYFFDTTDVSPYVQKSNILKVSGVVNFDDTWGNPDKITYLANSADLLATAIDVDSGNTNLFLANVRGTFPAGITVTGSKSGLTGTVLSLTSRSGNAQAGGANSITLAVHSSNTNTDYLGNTIYLCGGLGAGQSGTIVQYNVISKVVNVSSAWTTQPGSNTKYSIGSHFVERDGSIAGTFVLPNLPSLKFRTGERIFRVIDDPSNIVDNATCRADFRWLGTGLTEVKRDITIQHPQQPAPPPPSPVTPAPVTPHRRKRRDPVAETFFVDESVYPGGVFITSVDLFFASKDSILPVTVQIRPVVNGFPHSTDVLKNAEITLYPVDIRTSSAPSTTDSATATTFTFPMPIFLNPGMEYALVVLTDSLDYNIYVAELGKTIIGTTRIVSTQPYTGSFFKSQNGSTWTPVQEEDLMFVLKKAVFSTSTTGTIDLINQVPAANINVDSLYVYTSEDIYSNTSLSYQYSSDSGASFANLITKATYDLDSRFIVPATGDGTFRVRGTLRTNDRNLSPILYTEKFNMIGSENIINDLPIENTSITIVSGGTGYVTNSNIAVLITGGGGSGANAKVDQIVGGAIQNIILDARGSGYTGQANISIIGGTAGTNAQATVASETKPEGGLAVARYITRVITLADGFDAGDIRAYLTAYKPLNTDFLLYYKVRALIDPEPFSAKPWVLMTQVTTPSTYSESTDDIIEFEYRASPNTASIQYTTGTTTYDRFNQFAIKIVSRSSSSSVIPVAYDFRAIALPPSGI